MTITLSTKIDFIRLTSAIGNPAFQNLVTSEKDDLTNFMQSKQRDINHQTPRRLIFFLTISKS